MVFKPILNILIDLNRIGWFSNGVTSIKLPFTFIMFIYHVFTRTMWFTQMEMCVFCKGLQTTEGFHTKPKHAAYLNLTNKYMKRQFSKIHRRSACFLSLVWLTFTGAWVAVLENNRLEDQFWTLLLFPLKAGFCSMLTKHSWSLKPTASKLIQNLDKLYVKKSNIQRTVFHF